MAEAPAYVILGRGHWAQRMRPIIADENRTVATIEETRQRPSESESAYVARLAEATKASSTQIAWLCVPPGPHVTLMIQAALDAGLHIIVEKPWYGSTEDTQRLQSLSRARCRLLAVHFEYLVHRELEKEFSSRLRAALRRPFFPGPPRPKRSSRYRQSRLPSAGDSRICSASL